MNTFLKVLLIALLVVIAVKLLPLTLLAGCIVAAGALAVVVVGASAAAVVTCVALAIAAALAPIWLPVLAIVGVIALIKRSRRTVV